MLFLGLDFYLDNGLLPYFVVNFFVCVVHFDSILAIVSTITVNIDIITIHA